MARRLFIDVQHGLCNRLRAMASAAAIAKHTERELVVIWNPDHHCDCNLSDVLRYDGPVIGSPEIARLCRRQSQQFYNYMEIEENANFQQPILAYDTGGDVYVRSAYTLTSPYADAVLEQTFLRSLSPSDEVMELVNLVPYPSRVAMHVRMGTGPGFDHLSYESPENWPPERHAELTHWRAKSHMRHFIGRLDRLMAEETIDSVFLAADLPDVYQAFSERYGERMRSLPRRLFDRSAEQIQYAMADLILLTAADLFLASSWSSFSDLAQRLARPGRRVEKSGVDF